MKSFEEFKNAFHKEFGSYICVGEDELKDTYDHISSLGRELSVEQFLDYAKDYILSQGLEEEVVV